MGCRVVVSFSPRRGAVWGENEGKKNWLRMYLRRETLTFDEASGDSPLLLPLTGVLLCLGGVSFAPTSSLLSPDGEIDAGGGEREERDLGLENHVCAGGKQGVDVRV